MAYVLAQTFYFDAGTVGNSTTAFLTKVDLFFKAKPLTVNAPSGSTDPSVSVIIADCKADNTPDLQSIHVNSLKQLRASEITVSATAATATAFTFDDPVPLLTNKRYAIIIKLDDPEYSIWQAKLNEPIVGTSTRFQGFSGSNQGALFDFGNDGNLNPKAGTQLKYKIYVAKFTANNAVLEIVDRKYEFLTLSSQANNFLGGEQVIQVSANDSGTVALVGGSNNIVGTSTAFNTLFANSSANSYLAIYSNSTNLFTRKVVNVTNSTYITVDEAIPTAYTNASANYFRAVTGKVYDTDSSTGRLYLVDSNANSALYFAAGNSVVGTVTQSTGTIGSVDVVPISSIDPELGITTPPGGNVALAYNFAYTNGSVYQVNTSYLASIDNHKTTAITNYNALLLSRSLETNSAYSTYMYGPSQKSGLVKLSMTQEGTVANGLFTSPYVYAEQLDMFSGGNAINNSAADEEKVYGNAQAKHITTKISFEPGKSAEDLRVYSYAYVPAGTQLLAYAKVYNSKDPQPFNVKDWTPLQATNNTNTDISSLGSNTYFEYSWGIPSSPEVDFTLAGTVTATLNSSTITGSNTTFQTDLAVNDLVKIYSPLFPDQFQVSVVSTITNNSSLTLNETVANASIAGTGLLIDKIANNTYTAFINPQNGNVVRYYNSSTTQFDTFDTVQVKMVMLSNNVNITPRINNIRVIGVSA